MNLAHIVMMVTYSVVLWLLYIQQQVDNIVVNFEIYVFTWCFQIVELAAFVSSILCFE